MTPIKLGTFLLGGMLFVGQAIAGPIYLECRSTSLHEKDRHSVATVMVNPEGSLWNVFWVTLTVLYEDSGPGKDWRVLQYGQRTISKKTEHEFINAQASIGSKADERDLQSAILRSFNTADEFIEIVRQSYERKPRRSIASIYHLNRATLVLKGTYVGGEGIIEENLTFPCEISDRTSKVEWNEEIRKELQSIADAHNETIERSVPDESVGLENKI